MRKSRFGTLFLQAPSQAVEDTELIKELVAEVHSIRSSSGVGSPEVRDVVLLQLACSLLERA